MSEYLPRKFVEQERSRVCEPDSTFARRVVSQLRPVARPAGLLWDYVPSFARPMVASTTVLLLALISFQMIFPAPFPDGDVGIVDAYLGADAVPADEWLYRYAEPPAGEDLLIEISVAEGLQ
jgi:hypothetical protein